jgi:hypothetical protein
MSLIGVQLARRHMFADAAEVEDRAVTIRPSSTAVFAVDSADRYASVVDAAAGITSPYDFSITRKQSLLNGFFKRIAVTEVVFPYSIPNVNKQTNVILISYDEGAEQTITLTEGFYSPPALAALLQAGIIAATANAGITVTYNSTGQFVIDATAGHTLQLFDPVSNDVNAFTIFDLLGGTDAWLATPARIQVGRSTRARFTDFVDIVSPQLTYNQNLKDGSTDPIVRDVLCRVYIEDETSPVIPVYQTAAPAGPVMSASSVAIPGTYPFTIYRKFSMPKQIMWDNSQPIGNLTFQVYDSRGTLLSANSTVMPDYKCPDWRMTLLVSEN